MYLNSNNIIPLRQSGFRKGHITTAALCDLIDNIATAIDNKTTVAIVLLDFTKAFDTIKHLLLVSKCCYYGFTQKPLQFIAS
nr:unnamed protein product [Callosobruchus chinensis]